MNAPKVVWFFINSIFGIVLEEMRMAKISYGLTSDFIKMRKRRTNAKYEDLTAEEKAVVKKFFDLREEEDSFSLKLIHLESSVQLTFYLTLLLFSLFDERLMDKNYKKTQLNAASTRWILGLIWLIIKTLLSGYSTFAPILRIMEKESYLLKASAPSIVEYICKTINMLLDLSFAAGMTFLEWSYHILLELSKFKSL